MEKIKDSRWVRRVTKIVLICAIFLYPFLHTFIGIDLGDTGYHLYAFENLYKTPELIGFTAYLTTVIGWAWLKIFPGLGLWGLNLLEVFVEMLMVFVVYKTLKAYLGEIRTLIGLLLAIIASDTYLNIFNYHQFNVLLLVLILCFEFKAITADKIRFSAVGGLFFATVVFSRMGSITAIATCMLYVYWYFVEDKDIKFIFKHIGMFFAGAAGASCIYLILLKATGQLSYFMQNILRLFGLASADSGGYSMDNLMGTFIKGNLYSLASGALYFAGFFVLLLGFGMIFRKNEVIKKRIVSIVAGAAAVFIGVYIFKYSYYVNEIPTWPQMTPAPSFIIGIFYVITFLALCYHLYDEGGKKELSLIALMSIGLPLLTIAGSNTGTKHVILGLWIIAPFVVYVIGGLFISETARAKFNRLYSMLGITLSRTAWIFSFCLLIVSFLARYAEMAHDMINFDSTDRSLINSQIHSPKLKYLWTTERQANAVNGVLYELQKTGVNDDYPLIVYGGSIMFYYLTEMDSYVQPWFTNGVYSGEKLMEDMEKAEEKFENLPVIIYGRTNNYWGFYEFDYEKRINEMCRSTFGGKRDILLEFLEENNYSLQYVNDYYVVLYPEDIAEHKGEPYKGYITGVWEEDNGEQ